MGEGDLEKIVKEENDVGQLWPKTNRSNGGRICSPKVYLKKRGHWNPGEVAFSIHMETRSKQHKEMEDVERHSPGSPFKEGQGCSPAAERGVRKQRLVVLSSKLPQLQRANPPELTPFSGA